MEPIKWRDVQKVFTYIKLKEYEIIFWCNRGGIGLSGSEDRSESKPPEYSIAFFPKNPTFDKGLIYEETGRRIPDQYISYRSNVIEDIVVDAMRFISKFKE